MFLQNFTGGAHHLLAPVQNSVTTSTAVTVKSSAAKFFVTRCVCVCSWTKTSRQTQSTDKAPPPKKRPCTTRVRPIKQQTTGREKRNNQRPINQQTATIRYGEDYTTTSDQSSNREQPQKKKKQGPIKSTDQRPPATATAATTSDAHAPRTGGPACPSGRTGACSNPTRGPSQSCGSHTDSTAAESC